MVDPQAALMKIRGDDNEAKIRSDKIKEMLDNIPNFSKEKLDAKRRDIAAGVAIASGLQKTNQH